jgi:hypothetical protein
MNESTAPSQSKVTVYSLAGLRIASELPLPGLVPCGPADETLTRVEIIIRRAHVPESLSSVRVAFANGELNENEFLLKIAGVGRYLLRRGNEILVDQAPSSTPTEFRSYLLGTVFGALCHQRGITPLHASAISFANGCVAFVGESGSGKSTLAAALAQRGHEVIADDTCFLKLGNDRGVWAWPGINQIRLWKDAITALGFEARGVGPALDEWNKYLVPVHPQRNPLGARRLCRVYQLSAGMNESSPSMDRLQGATAIEVMMQNVYRLYLAEYMGFKPAAFVLCAEAAREVPVFRFSRPLVFDALGKGIDLLEGHLRDGC